jgi:hypothetical protein
MPLISRRWRLPAIILFLCLVALAVLSGPLFPFTPLPSDIAGAVAKAPDIDSYLSQREAAHAGVKPGLAKTVIWNDPTARHKSPLSLFYPWILGQPKGYRSGRREPGRHARRQRLFYPARRARPRDIGGIHHGHPAGLAERCPRSAGHRTQNWRPRDPDRNLDRRAAGGDGGDRGQLT